MRFPCAAGYSSGQEFITDLFKRANSNNLNILRIFTTGDDDQAVVLMQSPGELPHTTGDGRHLG